MQAISMGLKLGALGLLLLTAQAGAQLTATQTAPEALAGNTSGTQRLVRDGIVIDFEMLPVGSAERVTEGMFADIRFRISDVASGQPLSGMAPGAWLDQQLVSADPTQHAQQCKSRIGIYLKGMMGARPLLDFNSYYLVLMNQDASLSVIDPSTSLGGITSTLARIPLNRTPMDWAASHDDRLLYVSMPSSDEVALVDSERFQVLQNLSAGQKPTRVALQPDGRYLWIGNNAKRPEQSGVTVIDTATHETVLSQATGAGHHEIVFSEDSRHAFVSNRDAGSVTVFDTATLSKLRDITTGPRPLAMDYSPLSQAVYVSDGKTGDISVIDARTFALRQVIKGEPGVGPLRFDQEGRYAIALNTQQDRALVIDASTNQILHQLEVSSEPYQVVFTRAYAYVRGLSTGRVSMINLSSLGQGKQPIVQFFDAGAQAPKLAGNLPLADSLSAARADAAVFVVNPADNTAYFYMEGMNAPMSAYLNRGHSARAARVIDRSLRELEPGVFGTRIRLPVAGVFDVALMLNQPEITHCFRVEVSANPGLARPRDTLQVEFLLDSPTVSLGAPVKVRFRLREGSEGALRGGVKDLRVRYFRAPGSARQEVAAYEVDTGVYEFALDLSETGAYYLHVGSDSLGMAFGSQAYASLRALRSPSANDSRIPLSGKRSNL